jgi:uncharacterized protein
VIVVDTTILVYALGRDHPLCDPCRRLIDAVGGGRVEATTSPEVIQEFVHVFARRRSRRDAAAAGRRYALLLSPLLSYSEEHLEPALRLYERHDRLGAFDALLAAAVLEQEADALVSADAAFASVRRLTLIKPRTSAFDRLVAGAEGASS